jgi:energy-coupling factor transporter ATP-binding protein EcfA2
LLARARQVVENTRRQKDLRVEIERLMARGEGLMGSQSFPEAVVAFESVLRLDPGHARARERKDEAERRTGEALFLRWLPNQEPTLWLLPSEEVLESPTLSVQGVANDDRGVQKVEFRVDDRLIAEKVPPGEPERSLPFVKELPLAPGRNRVAVTAVDTGGLSFTIPFTVERRLRFQETPYFVPSALASAVSLLGIGWGVQRLRRRRAMRLRFNPYIAGAPVLDGQMFYGREKLTARMLSTLHRNSLMITGERRIGKTTFLHHLKGVLEHDEAGEWKFFPVFVDLQGVPEGAFFHALMAETTDALGLSSATQESLRFRPEREGYEARDFSHDLQLVLAELKGRTERRVKLALLIDEVDVLNEYSESVNQRLRGIFMKSFSDNLVAVMSGVAIKRRWKSEVSPWYNFFDEIELPPFSREEAEALIREPVAGVFRFPPEAVDSILELSRLRPYLVQKYCVHAVSHMLEAGRSTIRPEDVAAAHAAVESERRPEGDPATVQPVAD